MKHLVRILLLLLLMVDAFVTYFLMQYGKTPSLKALGILTIWIWFVILAWYWRKEFWRGPGKG